MLNLAAVYVLTEGAIQIPVINIFSLKLSVMIHNRTNLNKHENL